MKVDIDKLMENHYMKMLFIELANTVFMSDGNCKPCSNDANIALIKRLEDYYQMHGFGNADTGQLNEMDAYIATMLILSHL